MNEIIWLAALVVFLLVEANTISLVSVWFAAGALAALLTSLLGGTLWLQIGVFFAVSIVLLACLRPFVKKHIKPRISKTNVDAIVGAQGYVTEDIDNLNATGQVKLGAMQWSARSAQGEKIIKGTLVQVEKIEGVKVYVFPVAVEEKL